jgi:hypothetical protein
VRREDEMMRESENERMGELENGEREIKRMRGW